MKKTDENRGKEPADAVLFRFAVAWVCVMNLWSMDQLILASNALVSP